MQLEDRKAENKKSVLSLSGRLDFTRRQEFLGVIDGFFNDPPVLLEIQVDCTRLTYLDSSGLGLLLVIRDRARNFGCTVALLGCNGEIRDMLNTVQFGRLFRLA